MGCGGKPSPVVMFDRDSPVAVFTLYQGEVLFNAYNFLPRLFVIAPDEEVAAVLPLEVLSDGRLATYIPSKDEDPDYLDRLDALEPDVSYSSQIFLQAVAGVAEELGLYDVIDPYWLDHIPEPEHVMLWTTGVQRVDQTVLTNFPFDVRNSYRLREAQNG